LFIYIFFEVWKILVGTYGKPPHEYEAIMAFINGPYSTNFWLFEVICGLVIPVLILLVPKFKTTAGYLFAGLSNLVGIFIIRYDLVIGGQIVPLRLKEIPVILILEEEVGRYVLAMNVEKAHTIKDKSLEVVKLYEQLLAERPEEREIEFEGIFESGAYVTLGIVYKQVDRFHGSAYESILRRVDYLLDHPLREAYQIRQERANILKEVDEIAAEVVQKMREKGVNHPFLWQAVISSASPIKRKRIVEESYEEVMAKLKENLSRISEEDILGEELEEL